MFKKRPPNSGMKFNLDDDKPSTGSTLKTYKVGKSDLFLPETIEGTHVGPRYVVQEEIYLKEFNKNDIVNINDRCNNCEMEKREETMGGKLKKIKNIWTVRKCIFLGIVIIFIEIVLMILIYNMNAKENVDDFVSPFRIDMVNNNLEEFIPRKHWKLFFNSNNCTYECPKLKSKIRFIHVPSSVLICLNRHLDISVCDGYFPSLMRGSPIQYLRDTFCNYFVTELSRSIYEGRSLTCPHDEAILEEDHLSMITVGIVYDAHETLENDEKSLSITDTISDLITNLREKKILTTNYVLDFPGDWKSSYLLERLNRVPGIGHISFYEEALYKNLNVSGSLDPTLISKLLLLPKNSTENNMISRPHVKIQFPFTNLILLPNFSRSSIINETFTFRFATIYERKNFKFCESSKIVVQECWSEIMDLIYDKVDLEESAGNYFVFPGIRVVHGQIPEHFPNNLINDNWFVNILIIHDRYNGSSALSKDIFVWLADVFQSIRNDVWTRIIYSDIDYGYYRRFT